MGFDHTDRSIGVRALALKDEARVRPSNKTAKAVTPMLCGDPVFAKASQASLPPSVLICEAKRIRGSPLFDLTAKDTDSHRWALHHTDCSIGVRALALEDEARAHPSNKTAKAVTPTLAGGPSSLKLRRAGHPSPIRAHP